jgi:hypothetical protein
MSTYVENGEERLQHLGNLLKEKNVEHKPCGAGRRDGDKELPDFLRVLVGVGAKMSGSPAAAKAFGVSQPTALTASKGKRSPKGPDVPELKESIDGTIADARSKAVAGVMAALDLVPDKIDSSVKLRDLTSVAKDLAFVAEKLAPADEKAQKGNQVIFYMPKEKNVLDYDIIDVTPVSEDL